MQDSSAFLLTCLSNQGSCKLQVVELQGKGCVLGSLRDYWNRDHHCIPQTDTEWTWYMSDNRWQKQGAHRWDVFLYYNLACPKDGRYWRA